MTGQAGHFHLVDDEGKVLDFDMTPDFFTKRDRRKQKRHVKTARFIDDWGDTIASGVAMCTDVSVSAASFWAFQALDEASSGKKPTVPATIVHAVASIGLGVMSYMIVEKAMKLDLNAIYNNEALLGIGGMSYFEMMKASTTPPQNWNQKEAHLATVLEQVGDQCFKDTDW